MTTIPFAGLQVGGTFRFTGSAATYRKATEFTAFLVNANGDHRASARSGVDSAHLVIVEG